MNGADPTIERSRVMERIGSTYYRNEQDDHCWLVFMGLTRKIWRIWPDRTIEAIHLEHKTGIVWHTLIDMSQFDAEMYCDMAAKMLEAHFGEEIRGGSSRWSDDGTERGQADQSVPRDND